MSPVVADEMLRNAEDHVALQVFVIIDEDLRDERFVAWLVGEEM
jgi:hypothetical protein